MRRAVLLIALCVLTALVVGCGSRTAPSPLPDPTTPAGEATIPASEPVQTDDIVEPTGEVDAVEDTTPIETPTAEPTEIVVSDDPLASVDPTGQTVMLWHAFTAEREAELNALIDTFNDANEYGITIQSEAAGEVPELSTRMMVASEAGDLPGLVITFPYQATEFRERQEAIVDLAPYIESPAWGYGAAERERFLAPAINSDYNARLEEQLAFPLHRAVEVLYYNSDLLNELGFDSAPASWDEFREMSCAASEAGQVGYALVLSTSTFASMVYSRGGELLADGQLDLESPAVVETMEFLQGLSEAGCLTLVTGAFGDQLQFGAGNVLFAMGPSSELFRFQAAVEEGYGGDWAVAPLPYSTQEPVMALYGPSLSVGRTTDEQQVASWLFIKWLMEPEQQARWAQASGGFPVREDAAAQMEPLILESPNYQVALDLLQYGKGEPAIAGFDIARGFVDEAVIHVLQGSDITETLSDINEEVNIALEEAAP